MWSLALAFACSGPAQDGPRDPVVRDSLVQDTQDTQDTGPTEPSAWVDVLVVGSGPAGLSAAWAAQEAGAEVLILELADTVGPTTGYAVNYLLADTQAQRAAGVEDSLEQVGTEWADFTVGGDAQDPMVQAFIAALPQMEAWFLSLGAKITGPRPDHDAGETSRMHSVRVGESSPAEYLAEQLGERVWTQHRAVDLVLDQGAVVGVHYVDERSGTHGWVKAGATVLATGGFTRDLALVKAHRPELAGLELAFESHPLSQGAGRPLLAAAGAAEQNMDSVGVYVHGLADPRPGMEGEALLVPLLPIGMAVDGSGRRFAAEDEIWGLRMEQLLLQVEDQRVWVLFPKEEWAQMEVMVPGYNSQGSWERIPVDDLESYGAAQVYSDISSVAAGLGLPEEALSASFLAYSEAAESGVDSEFGKDVFLLRPFTGEIVAVELVAGVAKSFGGAHLDPSARVLDDRGAPIPGLYAGGEVAGMLGTPGVGRGFGGSITAVHWTGLVAGGNAGAYALGR